MSKKDYRIRNWREYNKALVERGSLTIWIEEKSIKNWYEKAAIDRPRGRQKKYSDMTIRMILTLKQVYRLTLRGSQGFVESIMKLLGKELKVPCYTQLCRRQSCLRLPRLPKLAGGIHLVVDSSGLKVFGEGEWKVRQHGLAKRRTWRKLHLGVAEKERLIVSMVLTTSSRSDVKQLPKLLNQYEGKLDQVSADGAYDSHDCVDAIIRRGSKATIPPQPNPEHKRKKEKDIKRARDQIVYQVQKLGREGWKRASGYYRRNTVENTFCRLKRLWGDKLMSHKLENQRIEAWLRCDVLNKMTLRGMPISIPLS